MISLQDKIVLITGASRGIGAATAREFVAAGARVALVARSSDALTQLAAELGAARACAISADLTDPASAARIVAQTLAMFGRADVLINNAGIGYRAALLRARPDQIAQVFGVNVFGALALTQHVARQMQTQGGGHVINVLTTASRIPIPFQGIYGASKAAFEMLTDTLRIELARSQVVVTGIYPGTVATTFNQNALREGETAAILEEYRADTSVQAVAHAIMRAAQQRPRATWLSGRGRRYVIASVLFPTWLDARMAETRDALEPPPPQTWDHLFKNS